MPLRRLAVIPLLAIALLAALSTSAAAEGCDSSSEFRRYDPPGDVKAPWGQTFSGLDEVDLLELNTCVMGDRILSELHANGNIAQGDARVTYNVYVWLANDTSYILRMYFSAGTAELEFHEGEGHVNWSVTGTTLVMSVNRSFLSNTTGGWLAEASASRDLDDGGTPYDRSDWVEDTSTYVPGAGGSTPGFEVGVAVAALMLLGRRRGRSRPHRRRVGIGPS